VSNTAGPKTTVHRHVSFGRPAHAIAEFAENEETDLVTMSTHGQTGLERFLLGSVTEKVVRHVECPVLTVKAFGHSLLPAHELRATGEHE
jgi:nucleotide-binding universal stress UspA family protein